MKRTRSHALTIGTLAALIASSSLGAQSTMGLKGGIALANMYGDAVGNVDLRNGLTGGLFIDIAATPWLFFTPQLLYTQKGAKQTELIDVGGGLTLAEGTWEYDYIDIAAVLKRKFGTGPVKIALYAGGVYSVLLSAKAIGDDGEIDLEDLTKSNDLGALIGGSLELAGGFLVDLSYSLGTIEFDEPPLNEVFSRKHNVISAMVGFRVGP